MGDEGDSRGAVLIQRVSKESKAREHSVADQEKENRADIEAEGWTVAATYSQRRSASRFARTGGRQETWAQTWKRIIGEINQGLYAVAGMWESSRGSRTPRDWFEFLDACRDSGTLIRVTSHHRTYDMRIARDWRTLAEDGVDNAYESEKTSDRSRRGIRTAIERKQAHGKPAYGYEQHYDTKTGRPTERVPHPERAPVAREIKERAAEGVPPSAIVRDLNTRKVPTETGVPWTIQVVKQIILNPVYMGQRRWAGDNGDGGLYDGNWTPLVTPETHYAGIEALATSGQQRWRPGRQQYMLSFVVLCGGCGIPIQGKPAAPGEMPGYSCKGACRNSTRAPWLDEFVSRLVIRRLSEPRLYEQLAAGEGTGLRDARADEARLRGKLAEAQDSYAAGRISIEMLEGVEQRVRPQLEAAARKTSSLEAAVYSVPLRALLAGPQADIEARWEDPALHPSQRKAVVRDLFESITLAPPAPGSPRGVRAFLDPARVTWKWREELR